MHKRKKNLYNSWKELHDSHILNLMCLFCEKGLKKEETGHCKTKEVSSWL